MVFEKIKDDILHSHLPCFKREFDISVFTGVNLRLYAKSFYANYLSSVIFRYNILKYNAL